MRIPKSTGGVVTFNTVVVQDVDGAVDVAVSKVSNLYEHEKIRRLQCYPSWAGEQKPA